MKKNVSAILVVGMVMVLLFAFSGCDKLSVSNLKGNYYLKQANKYYQEELYKKAITAYEEALSYNPELKMTYVYLGTSYSQVYRPMKENDPRNTMFGQKAEEYLLKALEYEPDREEIIVALGDFYDKTGNFEKAEEYYKMILEKKKDDPKSYYTLANFYQNNGKTDQAEEMYKRRIELDPKDPEGYHYYVDFLQKQRRWEDAINAHEKRLYCILDSDIIDMMGEIKELQNAIEQVKKKTEFMEMVKKNRRVDKAEKERLLNEAKEQLKEFPPLEEAEKKLDETRETMNKRIERANATADTLDEDKKGQVAVIYYSIGNVCWNWSYQTPTDFMAPELRQKIIEKGLNNLEKAIELDPNYAEPYSYMGLLWREMIKVNPLKRDEYIKKNEEYNKKFANIYKKKKRAEEYKEQLEKMGTEE